MSTLFAPPTALIVAKAPVPGFAKTRIAATTGDEWAARLAAAALLDTLDTVGELDWPVVVAMTGSLDDAVCADELRAALTGLDVIEQRGETFGQRLVHAHQDSDRGCGVVQIGMDSPQVTVHDWNAAGEVVSRGSRAIGLASDGGWWLLGAPSADQVVGIENVLMSHPRTGELTLAALPQPVERLRQLTDMDGWDEAKAIADATPGSRLAAVVEQLRFGLQSGAR